MMETGAHYDLCYLHSLTTEEAPCEYDDYEECSDDPDLWCDPEWMDPAPAEEVI